MENLKQQAYHLIKNQILSCAYAPNSYLSEKIIIDEIGMSRTPIRDALGRLEQEGLVEIQPKRGVWVSPLTFRDIDNLFAFRRLVEDYAMRHHAYKIPKEALQALAEQAAAVVDQAEAYTQDDLFHDTLIKSTENDYLMQAYGSMRNQIHRLRILTGRCSRGGNRMAVSRAEHGRIVQAMLAEDYEQAAHALSDHLSSSLNSAFALLTQDVDIDVGPNTGRKR